MGAWRWCAAIAACAVLAGTAVPAAAATPERTLAENESVARATVAALLPLAPLPPGTTPRSQPMLSALPGYPTGVDESVGYVTPGSLRETLEYVLAHVPAGLSRRSGGSSSGPGVVPNEWVGLSAPSVVGLRERPTLAISVAQAPVGESDLEVDASAIAEVPRPASEQIPGGARVLRVRVLRPLQRDRRPQPPIWITSPLKVAAAAAVLDGLPIVQPGAATPCPVDLGDRLQLAFLSARASSAPLASATVDAGGCGGATLDIGGLAQPPLEGFSLRARLERVLGRTLLRR